MVYQPVLCWIKAKHDYSTIRLTKKAKSQTNILFNAKQNIKTECVCFYITSTFLLLVSK